MSSIHGPRVVIALDRMPRTCDLPDAVVVTTPLDLIRTLDASSSVAVAILYDHFAREPEVASFLRETYPKLRLVASGAAMACPLE